MADGDEPLIARPLIARPLIARLWPGALALGLIAMIPVAGGPILGILMVLGFGTVVRVLLRRLRRAEPVPAT